MACLLVAERAGEVHLALPQNRGDFALPGSNYLERQNVLRFLGYLQVGRKFLPKRIDPFAGMDLVLSLQNCLVHLLGFVLTKKPQHKLCLHIHPDVGGYGAV